MSCLGHTTAHFPFSHCILSKGINLSLRYFLPMSGWVCQSKPFGIPVGDSFKKGFMEEWVFISDEHTDEEAPMDDSVLQSTDYSDCIPGTTRISKQSDPVPCEPTIPRDKAYFRERLEAPLPPLRQRPKCNFIHPQQLSLFPERMEFPFPSGEILSGYEDIVSSGSDHFTTWVKLSPHEVLAEHVVDVQKVMADFREASERRQASSSQTYGANKYSSSQSLLQRLSIYNWNTGPRRGRGGAFENQIAGK